MGNFHPNLGAGVASQLDADTTAPMAFNQGFYNLFLAIGAIVGIALVAGDHDPEGWTLILFSCGSMRAAATQGLFPLMAVVASVIAAR